MFSGSVSGWGVIEPPPLSCKTTERKENPCDQIQYTNLFWIKCVHSFTKKVLLSQKSRCSSENQLLKESSGYTSKFFQMALLAATKIAFVQQICVGVVRFQPPSHSPSTRWVGSSFHLQAVSYSPVQILMRK